MANTLKFGNGKWYGKKDTILAYNDENSNYKPLPFDFSRASSATVINKDGLIETVGSGQPRIDYKDDSKGAMLLEPSRGNLFTNSEDFSDSGWIKQSGVTPTYNTTETLSPDGTYNATKLIGNGTTGIYDAVAVSGVVSRSIYIKSVTGNINVILKDPQNTVTQKTLNVTTQWQRFDLTEDNTTSSQGIWIDDIPASGIYMWGAQLEQGSYPTSYIPTQGSAVTRLADVCNNGGNDQVINSTEGVLYAEISGFVNDALSRAISINDGTTSNRINLFLPSSQTQVVGRVSSGGAIVADMIYSGITQTSYNKIAVKWKVNDFALWVNGVEVLTDSSGVVPIGLNEISFDNASSAVFLGNVKDVRVYNTALTDQELTELTS